MPAELPGFYYDSDRNRYFPIPRSGGGNIGPPSHKPKISELPEDRGQDEDVLGPREKPFNLILSRESGLDSRTNHTSSFPTRFLESRASSMQIWQYGEQRRRADGALMWMRSRATTDEGDADVAVLFVGGTHGSLSVWETDLKDHESDGSDRLNSPIPPRLTSISDGGSPPGGFPRPPPILRGSAEEVVFSSPVRAIHRLPGGDRGVEERPAERVVVATFGSADMGGAVMLMDGQDAVTGAYRRVHPGVPAGGVPVSAARLAWRIEATHCLEGWTLWSAGVGPTGGDLSLGHSNGAAILDLHRSQTRKMFRSDSAVLSQQRDETGKLVFCGFRNGAISTIDLRLPPPPSPSASSFAGSAPTNRVSSRGMRHHFVQQQQQQGKAQLLTRRKKTRKMWQNGKRTSGSKAEVSSHYCSHTQIIKMSSCVCSMHLLRFDQNYLVAGAADGSLQRFDRRKVTSPVLSYDGHRNTHTFLPLAVDPTESLLMASGEDCAVRLWNVNSGRLLSSTKPDSNPISSFCWPSLEESRDKYMKDCRWSDGWFEDKNFWGCWMGSSTSVFYGH